MYLKCQGEWDYQAPWQPVAEISDDVEEGDVSPEDGMNLFQGIVGEIADSGILAVKIPALSVILLTSWISKSAGPSRVTLAPLEKSSLNKPRLSEIPPWLMDSPSSYAIPFTDWI